MNESDVREQVRRRYAAAATAVTTRSADPLTLVDAHRASCCGDPEGEVVVDEAFGASLYGTVEQGELPADALLASLGCGNPTAVAELREGETVMTDEMLALADANTARAGATNVEFLKGTIEDVPLEDAAIDVVISNCVVNLSTDKPA